MMMTARHQGSFDDRPHEDKYEDRFPFNGRGCGPAQGRASVCSLPSLSRCAVAGWRDPQRGTRAGVP